MKVIYAPLVNEYRDNRDIDFMELVLTIIKNLLAVPNQEVSNSEETLHQRTIRVFHQCGIPELVINLSNDMDENFPLALLLQDMMVHLFRGTPLSPLFASPTKKGGWAGIPSCSCCHLTAVSSLPSPANTLPLGGCATPEVTAESLVSSVAEKKATSHESIEKQFRALRDREDTIEKKNKRNKAARHGRFGGAWLVDRVQGQTVRERANWHQKCHLTCRQPANRMQIPTEADSLDFAGHKETLSRWRPSPLEEPGQ